MITQVHFWNDWRGPCLNCNTPTVMVLISFYLFFNFTVTLQVIRRKIYLNVYLEKKYLTM